MRPSHLLPVAGVTFLLTALSPLLRGDDTRVAAPAPRAAAPAARAGMPVVADLPVTRVVLFNAGVGYVAREGSVEGNARLELRFPEGDVNDLIKSLVLADKDGGKVGAVTYDNRTPVEFALKSFALDLTQNPTVGQLLHQVRGEKVEVTDRVGTVLVGQIVSVEKEPAVGNTPAMEQLNLLTVDGIQSVEMKAAKKIRLMRPELQAEFRKALEVMAAARGDGKKAVSVVFTGNGRRRVAVGYVTEAPMWKPTYRLTVDGKGAARIQGWAAIENTTDEDWVNVKVGLVAGRPVSFQMDLYDPLFVPRPTVEPDLFASLRPPMYQGIMNRDQPAIGGAINPANNPFANNIQQQAQVQNGNFVPQNGFAGGMMGMGGFNQLGGQFGMQGAQFGMQGMNYFNNGYMPRVQRQDVRDLFGQRLTYEEFLGRVRNPNGGGKVNSGPQNVNVQRKIKDPFDPNLGVFAGGSLGDSFEYKIEAPVNLPRQKSALLPIVDEPVQGERVSIYNARVLGKHPLQGLRLQNKTKLNLAQGPVTVYESDTFAGDARLPDMKPGEERLISYAIDLGTEVVVTVPKTENTMVGVKVKAGRVETASRDTRTTRYVIHNRNPQDRAMVVEHPVTTDWKLRAPVKATDQTRSFYRFDMAAKTGATITLEVQEEHDGTSSFDLAGSPDSSLLFYSKHEATKPAVRKVLGALLDMRGKLADVKKGLETELAALKEIGDDQDRIRKNLDRVPKESDAYRRYLKKFDDQETEIEQRQAKVKEFRIEIVKQEKALRDFVETAKAE